MEREAEMERPTERGPFQVYSFLSPFSATNELLLPLQVLSFWLDIPSGELVNQPCNELTLLQSNKVSTYKPIFHLNSLSGQ